MIAYLIDTNVVSELDKPRPDTNVKRWFEQAAPDRLFASVVTLGEIRLGIESLPPGKRRSDLERWLDHGLPDWFASNLLPVTDRIADRWARITVQARRNGLNPTNGWNDRRNRTRASTHPRHAQRERLHRSRRTAPQPFGTPNDSRKQVLGAELYAE